MGKGCKFGFHIVFFEDLQKHTEDELAKIVEYLAKVNKKSIKFRRNCVKADGEGQFKRDWRIDYLRVSRKLDVNLTKTLNRKLMALNQTLKNSIPQSYLMDPGNKNKSLIFFR